MEREGTPQRNKFRDGYYDLEVYERTDTGKSYLVEMLDSDRVRADYERKGFNFPQYNDVNSYWIGFNMLDPVLGWGENAQARERGRKLRQAIAIAIDWDEYSQIFPKKAGTTAMSPLPSGIFGSREGTPEGVNPFTHKLVDGKVVRRPIEDARKLMVEAGYPDGRDAKTGAPLVLNYDFYAPPTPERKPEIDWVVKQFRKIDIQLEVRATDNNQFQDKVRKGKHQVFWLGWNADYPDAENFLFLFYGPNSKSELRRREHAELPEPRLRQALPAAQDHGRRSGEAGHHRQDGAHPAGGRADQHGLLPLRVGGHAELGRTTPSPRSWCATTAATSRLDIAKRQASLAAWNRPVWWPLVLLAAVVLAAWLYIRGALRRRERMNARGELLPT